MPLNTGNDSSIGEVHSSGNATRTTGGSRLSKMTTESPPSGEMANATQAQSGTANKSALAIIVGSQSERHSAAAPDVKSLAVPQDTARISTQLKKDGQHSPNTPSRAASYTALNGQSFLNRATFFSSPLVDGGPKAANTVNRTASQCGTAPPPPPPPSCWGRAKNTFEV